MPKLSDKKVTIRQLSKLSAEERTKIWEPIIKANTEQFAKIINSVGELLKMSMTNTISH